MERLSVEEFVDAAIVEGFQCGCQSFLESIEGSIRNNTLLQETSSVEDYLQEMIDNEQQQKMSSYAQENFANLSEKLSSVLNR